MIKISGWNGVGLHFEELWEMWGITDLLVIYWCKLLYIHTSLLYITHSTVHVPSCPQVPCQAQDESEDKLWVLARCASLPALDQTSQNPQRKSIGGWTCLEPIDAVCWIHRLQFWADVQRVRAKWKTTKQLCFEHDGSKPHARHLSNRRMRIVTGCLLIIFTRGFRSIRHTDLTWFNAHLSIQHYPTVWLLIFICLFFEAFDFWTRPQNSLRP